ncbi:hypothetical protein ACTHAM_001361 [Cellulomonas soli]|uniref:hypothetical protein n=1 Tax=Cellulomonas soli TaxID=931535 RepID=UPI003F87731C
MSGLVRGLLEQGGVCAPGEEGATVRVNLGTLAVNDRASLTLYVGVTRTSAAALNAIGGIDPALYALAEPTNPGGAVGTFAISGLTHSTPTTTAASGPEPS